MFYLWNHFFIFRFTFNNFTVFCLYFQLKIISWKCFFYLSFFKSNLNSLKSDSICFRHTLLRYLWISYMFCVIVTAKWANAVLKPRNQTLPESGFSGFISMRSADQNKKIQWTQYSDLTSLIKKEAVWRRRGKLSHFFLSSEI